MSWDEVRQLAKKEGYAEGVADGIVQGISQGRLEGISQGRATLQDIILEHLSTLGEIPEEVRTRITSETDMDVLREDNDDSPLFGRHCL